MKRTAKIFLNYARENITQVKEIYAMLKEVRFDPWMDKNNLFGSEIWWSTIENEISNSDIFIACLSHNSINKGGYLQKEIDIALVRLVKTPNKFAIIPLRLEDCKIPKNLSKIQWVDYFAEDAGNQLVRAIRKSMDSLGIIESIYLRTSPLSLSHEEAVEMFKKLCSSRSFRNYQRIKMYKKAIP